MATVMIQARVQAEVRARIAIPTGAASGRIGVDVLARAGSSEKVVYQKWVHTGPYDRRQHGEGQPVGPGFAGCDTAEDCRLFIRVVPSKWDSRHVVRLP